MLHQGSVCVNHLIGSNTPFVIPDKDTNYHSNGAQRIIKEARDARFPQTLSGLGVPGGVGIVVMSASSNFRCEVRLFKVASTLTWKTLRLTWAKGPIH